MTRKQTSVTEFSSLAEEEKLALLRNDGVYVGKVSRGTGVTMFFQLYSFYVEINYLAYRRKVAGMTVFEEVDALSPYLAQVIVRELDKSETED